MSKLYLVRDKKGRIFGPYTTEEISFHIEEGEFKGEEEFSTYPTGKWQVLSTSPVFYKQIISKLNREEKTQKAKEEFSQLSDNMTFEEQQTLEPTRILKVDNKEEKKKVKIKLSKEFREEVLEDEAFDDIIDMGSPKEQKFNFQKLIRYGILAGILLFFVFALTPSSQKTKLFQAERLLAPESKKPKITKEELKKRFQTATSFYKKGSLADYVKAQKLYVELLEIFPEETPFYTFLCLTHLEIWPISYQDTEDRRALQKVLNLIQEKDKNQARFCLARSLYLENKFPAVMKITETLLKDPEQPVSHAFIFYLQAKTLKNLNRTKEALSLLDTTINLDPHWISPVLLKANIYYDNQMYNNAIQEYQKILKLYPQHDSALIRLAVLEYKHLKQSSKAKATLKKAFSKRMPKVTPDLLFDAYLLRGRIALDAGKKNELLSNIKKAYALGPNNPDVIKLKNKINNKPTFEKTKIEDRALIHRGDLLAKEGDCLKAITRFTEAYKFTRSALAAFKIGKCYWTLKTTGQSIRWLKRAINIDPYFLEAHLVLADYLSQIYQFDYARDTLNSIVRKYPNNPEVYRTYAKMTFRSKLYLQTIAYGERVLNFYPNDIEALVLLSQTHFAMDKVNLAYFYAKKAIQQNPENVSAQISYAVILDYKGEELDTVSYLRNKIEEHPEDFEYHEALCQYFYDKEKYEQAKEELEKLIAKKPKLQSAYMLLGLTYTELSLKNKKYTELAIKNFREASLIDLSDVKPIFYVGQIHLNNGNYAMAEKEFNKVIQINPNYPLIHYHFGLSVLHQRNKESLDLALKAAQTEAVKNPRNYLPYKLAGDVYRLKSQKSFKKELDRKKMYGLCAKEYQKALKYVEKNIEVSMNLLLCYKGSGNTDKALELAKSLSEEEGLSGYPEIYREIASIFEFKEEYERALSYYKIYFQLRPSAKDRSEIERRMVSLIDNKKKLSQPEEE